MSKAISVDLESMGTGADARIMSIGACYFDVDTGEIGDRFYVVIDQDQPGGGTLDISTVLWWLKQDEAARKELFAPEVERIGLAQALVGFSEFIGFNDQLPEGEYPDVELWQRGNKDEQWLTSAYQGMGLAVPFRYWQWNDQRTLAKKCPARAERYGVGHNALDDAIHQAHELIAIERQYFAKVEGESEASC